MESGTPGRGARVPARRAWRRRDRLPIEGLSPDGVRVQGSILSTFESECRRCLADIILPVRAEVDVWFRTESQVIPGEDGVWAFAPGAGEIELAGAIREELLLTIPDYPVVRRDVRGLVCIVWGSSCGGGVHVSTTPGRPQVGCADGAWGS